MVFRLNTRRFARWISQKCARLRGWLTGDGLFVFFELLDFNIVSL